jgi:four helix bundle protein
MQNGAGAEPHLDHENLDVYRRGIDFLAVALGLMQSLGRGDAEIRDQLKRAAMSIVLNIAEGAGKPAVADRARYYAAARGSAMECGALLDVCMLAGRGRCEQVTEGKALLVRIVSMLTKMCR